MKKNIMIAGTAIVLIIGITVGFIVVPMLLTPPVEDDGIPWPTSGWSTATHEEQNVSTPFIDLMYDYIYDNEINMHSMLIVRNGYIVEEQYLENYTLREDKNYSDTTTQLYLDTQKHALYSCTKSVIGILIGIAIDNGFIDNISQKFFDFYPERWNSTWDTRKQDITIENLLRMESGLLGNYWGVQPETYGDDYLQRRLDQPMAYDPGAGWNETWFHYSNNGVDLLSAIINKSTGMLTSEFAQQYLFDPLGIPEENYHWREIDGLNTGGSGLYMYPRDMGKLGLLCLYNGTWDGSQVVSSEWMAATLNDYPGDVPYGYLVWSSPTPSPVIYYFGGANGQRVTIIPEYNTVVIITADTGKDNLYNGMLRDYVFEGMW